MLKILIVDDDAVVRTILKKYIRNNFSCAIYEAENGEAGYDLITSNRIDLVFLDYHMPLLNGIETLEKIRGNALIKNIAVVSLTTVSEKNIVGRLLELGIIDYLLKPISADTGKRIQKIISELQIKREGEINSKANKDNILF